MPQLGEYGVRRVDSMIYRGMSTAEIARLLKIAQKDIRVDSFRRWVYGRRRRLFGVNIGAASRRASATALAVTTYAMLRVAAGSEAGLNDVMQRLANLHARRLRRPGQDRESNGGETTA